MNAIKIQQLSKQFKDKKAVNNLSLTVEKNQVYGILGPNGAGKSTTINMILGLLKPTQGSIEVLGEEVKFGDTKFLNRVGYINDVPEFYDYMNAREYLAFVLSIFKDKDSSKIKKVLEFVGLDDNKMKIKNYSRGMKQRLGIAQALINDPELIIMDEPTSALDPIGRKEILDIIKNLSKETTVFYSTHLLDDVERVCDSIAIINNGELLLEGSMKEVKEKFIEDVYLVSFNKQIEETDLMNLKSVHEVSFDSLYRINASSDFGKEIIEFCYKNKLELTLFKQSEMTLEDIFLKVVNNDV
jgi:ABC-2 type transport system ATP-binding protein